MSRKGKLKQTIRGAAVMEFVACKNVFATHGETVIALGRES
jgi:hypothetical protein